MKKWLFLLLPLSLWAQTPEVVLTVGHTDQVNCLAFSPDGRFLATGGNDKNIKLWDVRTAREMRTFSGNDGRLVYVEFGLGGKILAGLNYNEQLRVWETTTGKLLMSHEAGVTTEQFNFTKDGKEIVYVNKDNDVVIANPLTGDVLKTVDLGDTYPHRMEVNSDGKTAYILDHKGALIEFDLLAGKENKRVQLHKTFLFSPTTIHLSPDEKLLAVSFDDKSVRLIQTADFNEYAKFPNHELRLKAIAFDRTGNLLVTADFSQQISVYDVQKKKKIISYAKTIMGVNCLATHPKEQILAFGEFKTVHYVNGENGAVLKTFVAKGNRIMSMSYDQQGKYLATAADDISIKIWNVSNLRIDRVLQGFFPVEFSPDGKNVVCMGPQINLRVYDPATGEIRKELNTESELIQNLSFSKDGKYIAGAGFMGLLKVWDMESGKMIHRLGGHAGGIYASSFSPDGKWIATCGLDNTIRIWDAQSGKELATLTGHDVLINEVEFSPDGKKLASAAWDKTVKVWETGTWKLLKTLEGHNNIVTCLDFSGDGKLLATGAGNNVVAPADNSIRLWSMEDYQPVCRFENPTGQINKVVFEKNGNLLFSCSEDGMVKVWDYRKCGQIASFICSNYSDYIILTPDNYYTASRDALNAVSFLVGEQIYPFEQFDIRLNRPDIVASRMGKTPANLINAFMYVYQKRLKRLNYKEDDLGKEFEVPLLEVRKTDIPLVTREKQVKFTVKMRDMKHLLDRLNVYVNDVPVYGPRGYDLQPTASGSIDMEVIADIIPGQNKIKVSCVNAIGAESLIEEFTIMREGDADKGDLYVICMGVSTYNDSRFNLRYAAKDATDMMERLAKNDGRYNNVYKRLLVNEQVVKQNIYALSSFLANTKPEDMIVVFLAGHGVLDKNFEYFYGTYDLDFNEPEKNGVSYEQIESIFALVKAQKKLLIMDTCHSGELDKDEIEEGDKAEVEIKDVSFRAVGAGIRTRESFGVANSMELMNMLFTDVKRGTGTVVISSAGGAEFAMESGEWKNGLFTYCLLSAQGDYTADVNRDQHFSVSEIRKYTYEKVVQLSGGRQKPTTRSDNLALDFILW